ncbi:MAG: hypothetical protein PVH25_10275, partial [Burkholderiales bacterium]
MSGSGAICSCLPGGRCELQVAGAVEYTPALKCAKTIPDRGLRNIPLVLVHVPRNVLPVLKGTGIQNAQFNRQKKSTTPLIQARDS